MNEKYHIQMLDQLQAQIKKDKSKITKDLTRKFKQPKYYNQHIVSYDYDNGKLELDIVFIDLRKGDK